MKYLITAIAILFTVFLFTMCSGNPDDVKFCDELARQSWHTLNVSSPLEGNTSSRNSYNGYMELRDGGSHSPERVGNFLMSTFESRFKVESVKDSFEPFEEEELDGVKWNVRRGERECTIKVTKSKYYSTMLLRFSHNI